MSNEKAKRLLARRKELIDEMAALSHALYGTWYERFSTCSRPNCRCHQGELHGPRYYVVANRAGRQIQKYIPIGQKDEVLKGMDQGRRVREILDEITDINLELIKERAYVDS
jgi:hypothetical protein